MKCIKCPCGKKTFKIYDRGDRVEVTCNDCDKVMFGMHKKNPATEEAVKTAMAGVLPQ